MLTTFRGLASVATPARPLETMRLLRWRLVLHTWVFVAGRASERTKPGQNKQKAHAHIGTFTFARCGGDCATDGNVRRVRKVSATELRVPNKKYNIFRCSRLSLTAHKWECWGIIYDIHPLMRMR